MWNREDFSFSSSWTQRRSFFLVLLLTITDHKHPCEVGQLQWNSPSTRGQSTFHFHTGHMEPFRARKRLITLFGSFSASPAAYCCRPALLHTEFKRRTAYITHTLHTTLSSMLKTWKLKVGKNGEKKYCLNHKTIFISFGLSLGGPPVVMSASLMMSRFPL